MKVAIITEEQKDLLIGAKVQQDWYFHPVIDGNGNNIITESEIVNSSFAENNWVKDLSLTEYVPKN